MKRFFYRLWLPLCFALVEAQPLWALPSISANETSIASTLPLDWQSSTTTRIVKVATLSLATDNANGYTLTIGSGDLAKPGEAPISFQVVTVLANDSAPDSGDFAVSSGNNYTLSTNAAGSSSRDLYIKYTPEVFQDPGAYSASIAMTIVDNP